MIPGRPQQRIFFKEAVGAEDAPSQLRVMKQLTEGYFQQRQPQIVANSGAIVDNSGAIVAQ